MTFEKKFSSLKTKFIKADVKKLPENFAIQLTMTDEDCAGTFYIACFDGTLSVEPYDYVDSSAAVTATSAAISHLADGKFDSSIEVFGDEQLVKTIAAAYEKPKKTVAKKSPAKTVKAAKPVAKKAPAKETTAKKTAVKANSKASATKAAK